MHTEGVERFGLVPSCQVLEDESKVLPRESRQPHEGPRRELPQLAELDGELLEARQEAEVLRAEVRLGEEQVRARQPHPHGLVQLHVRLRLRARQSTLMGEIQSNTG